MAVHQVQALRGRLRGIAADAIGSLGRTTELVAARPGTSLFDALLTAAREDHPDESTLDQLVRQALLSVLEERRSRELALGLSRKGGGSLTGRT